MGWDVYLYDNGREFHYENVTTERLSIDAPTLLIFDDADKYDAFGKNIDRDSSKVNDFSDNFFDLMIDVIPKSSKRNKLRVLFTFTQSAFMTDSDKRDANNFLWWEMLSTPFKGSSYGKSPLEIEWSPKQILELVTEYRLTEYPNTDTFTATQFDVYMKLLEEWIENPDNVDYATPLTGMFFLDAYVIGRKGKDLETQINKLPIKIAALLDVKSAEMYKLEKYIKILEFYMRDFHEKADLDRKLDELDIGKTGQRVSNDSNLTITKDERTILQ